MIEKRIGKLAARPVSAVAEVAGRGYTPAKRLLVTFEDGSTAFAKVAVNESTAEWLAVEHVVYSQVEGSFLPRFLGYDDAEPALLLLEDLSEAHWPPPWPEGSISAVLEALEKIAATWLRTRCRRTSIARSSARAGRSSSRPGPVPVVRAVLARVLVEALPTLLEAARAAPIEGSRLTSTCAATTSHCKAIAPSSSTGTGRASGTRCSTGRPGRRRCMSRAALRRRSSCRNARRVSAMLAGFWALRVGLPPPDGARRRACEIYSWPSSGSSSRGRSGRSTCRR